MAVLSDADRLDVWAEWMRRNTAAVGITKPQLRAAVDAADQWAEDNAAAFNAALPQPARGALSAAQKAQLLSYVMQKRWDGGGA